MEQSFIVVHGNVLLSCLVWVDVAALHCDGDGAGVRLFTITHQHGNCKVVHPEALAVVRCLTSADLKVSASCKYQEKG